MDYFRNRLTSRGANDDSREESTRNPRPERAGVIIHPGLVEEAVHRIDHQGGIDLSELRFGVGESSSSISAGKDSVLDIAIFQVPAHCNSQACDLSQYGVGLLERYNGMEYLSLCGNDGRLQIQRDVFRGHHMEIPVPREGDLPQDRIFDGAEIIVAERDRTYEVMLANCNKAGRDISLSGQVVFESFGRASSLGAQDDVSGFHLLLVGVAVFVLFTLCSFRIHMGTRADYTYSRLIPIFHQTEGTIIEEYVVRRDQPTQRDEDPPPVVETSEMDDNVNAPHLQQVQVV